jgi:SAM-dependent methyltransferase
MPAWANDTSRALRHDARMAVHAPLAELLACPACGTRLSGAGCLACRIDFPDIGGIPWLMPEPRLALTEWRGRLHHLLTHYATEASRQRAALDGAPASGLTRRRLEHVAAALDDQAVRLRELMRPLGLDRRTEAHAVHVALGTELPLSQGLSTYYPNLHRDWCWGDAENKASLEAVLSSLPQAAPPGRVLVLGAGAGRLAYDLHMALKPSLTVALDFNPLFLLAETHILGGATLELYEFPIAPRTIEDHAVLRRHGAPALPAPGLELVLADASAPPFQPGRFDVVLTPWFIDVATEPASRLLARINALVAPGGQWVNHGSLTFASAAPAGRMEPRRAARAHARPGFCEARHPGSAAAVSRSPRAGTRASSRSSRSAPGRSHECPHPVRAATCRNGSGERTGPSRCCRHFRAQALSTRVYAFLLAMIDGERTIHDMARLMEQQKLMPADDAVPAIQRFLRAALQDPDRRPHF